MRDAVQFLSGGQRCAAWHYPADGSSCVVMAGGAGVVKEPATDRFAARFQDAGHHVLAFDHRRFGASEGRPRQVVKIREQLADWHAAIDAATRLPGVDAARVVAWGFSLAGGHLLRVAATSTVVRGVIAQTPLVDGLAALPNALRHETVRVATVFPLLALVDAVGARVGAAPRLVPLSGPRGAVAALTTPDAQDAQRALDPEQRHTEWQQVIAARSVLRLAAYRPVHSAAAARCPVLVVLADHDQSVLPGPARRAAARIPDVEVLTVSGGHYAPFLDQHQTVVRAELEFLARVLGGM